MSGLSSGGVGSSVSRTASTIAATGSASAARTSLAVSVSVRGRPQTTSRPRSVVLLLGHERRGGPTASLISSALRLADRQAVLAAEVRRDRVVEVVAADPQRGPRRSRRARATATSLVPPPMSTTI